MSLNSTHVNIMVFSDEQIKAEKKMREIVLLNGDKILRDYGDRIDTEGGRYQARKWSKYYRGYRYHDVYIDSVLLDDSETIGAILAKLRPTDPYDNTYNWKEHVRYF